MLGTDKDLSTTLICLLDKQDPPDHSFVTGMLGRALPALGGIRVQLVVGKQTHNRSTPRRYYKSVLLPMLPPIPRSGFDRVRLAIYGAASIRALIRKGQHRGDRIVLFVRNDPILLFIAKFYRKSVNSVIFQSSFPLEESHRSKIKCWLHGAAYRIWKTRVDGVIGVSPLGLQRIKNIFPDVRCSMVVPLLSDYERSSGASSRSAIDRGASVRFVYAGTHRRKRRLNIVLQGIVKAMTRGVDAEFLFVGGTEEEIAELRHVEGVRDLECAGRIVFRPAVPRFRLPRIFSDQDVGLSLIPSVTIYREASPTKVAEYLSSGLAVLVSQGIELQEEFVREAQAGMLVHFDATSIADGICAIVEDKERINSYKKSAESFARERLRYESYAPSFFKFISCSGCLTKPTDE